MNGCRYLLLKIMSSVLVGCELPRLNDVNWTALNHEAKMQTVFLQVFNKILPFLPTTEASLWEKDAMKIYAQNLEIAREHGRLHKVMSQHGIPHVAIKGLASAKYYPESLDRTFGDIDLIVSPDRIEDAYKIILGLGYKFSEEKKIDLSQDIGLYTYQGSHHVDLELHPRMNALPSGKAGERVREYLSDLIESGQEYGAGLEKCIIPDEKHHCLILLIHMAGHLTKEGIGLRHLCDWAAFINHIPDQQFREEFQSMLQDCGLFRFAQVITLVCEKYLGTPEKSWDGEADADLLEGLIDDILSGGNFGTKDYSRYQQIKYISNREDNTVSQNSSIKQVFHSINAKAKTQYPEIMKRALTKPVGWGAVMIEYIIKFVRVKKWRHNPVLLINNAGMRKKLYQQLDLYKVSG